MLRVGASLTTARAQFERGFSGLAEGFRATPDELLCRYCKLPPEQIIHSFWVWHDTEIGLQFVADVVALTLAIAGIQ